MHHLRIYIILSFYTYLYNILLLLLWYYDAFPSEKKAFAWGCRGARCSYSRPEIDGVRRLKVSRYDYIVSILWRIILILFMIRWIDKSYDATLNTYVLYICIIFILAVCGPHRHAPSSIISSWCNIIWVYSRS